jgi:hypothetical protein
MMGLVFTSLVDMIETEWSPEFADTLLSDARLPHGGAYTAVGHYPFAEMQTLLGLLCERTGIPATDMLRRFGRCLFDDIHRSHAAVLEGVDSFLDLMEQLDRHIHREVHKLHPSTELPEFTVLERSEDRIRLAYRSPRQLQHLALGLIDGAAALYDLMVDVELTDQADGSTVFDIRI